MHLVGFIIRIYQDARSPERQIHSPDYKADRKFRLNIILRQILTALTQTVFRYAARLTQTSLYYPTYFDLTFDFHVMLPPPPRSRRNLRHSDTLEEYQEG